MVCPTCKGTGRVTSKPRSITDLVNLLKDGHRGGRDIFQAENGGYFITYGGEPVDFSLIQEGLKLGILEPTYPDAPSGCWSLTELRIGRIRRFNPAYQAKLKEKGLI